MNITIYYAIFSGALIALPVIVRTVRFVSGLVRKCQYSLSGYVLALTRITHLEAFLILAVLAANALCISINVHSAQTLMYRSGLLSSINFAFLISGYHISSMYKRSGLLLSDYGRIHYWAAGISITEALVHSITAAILKMGKKDILSFISAWTAFSAIIIMLLSSFAFYTGRYYEAFAVTHQFLAAVIIVTVWAHAGRGGWNTIPSVYLLGAAGILTITRCFWLLGIMCNNLRIGSKLGRATVERDGKIMIVSVTLPRPWDFRAGQNVKICIPWLSWGSILQWHPFAISSYELVDGNMVIRLIIRERQGFTAILASKGGSDCKMLAFIDGPYGRELQLRTYGTVLLFASGIGIAGLLLYVHQTLEEYDSQRTSCRRILLFWEIDDSTAYNSIIESHVQRLLSHSILELQLIYTRLDIKKEIYTSIKSVRGSIAVLTCVGQKASEEARKLRQDLFKMKVHLFELEFRPDLVNRDE